MESRLRIRQRRDSEHSFAGIGPTDQIDLEGINWVTTGGESGPNARVMNRDWLLPVVANAMKHDAALWHKQNGCRSTAGKASRREGRSYDRSRDHRELPDVYESLGPRFL